MTECSIEGCELTMRKRGWCPMHYQRWRLRGDVGGPTTEKVRTFCQVEGCAKPGSWHGLCAMHWDRHRRNGTVELQPKLSVVDRFWSHVNKAGPIVVPELGPCWPWTGYRQKAGYGKFRVNGKNVSAHRFSYELKNGPLPEGKWACHKCDNRPCVREDHLFAGTAADNTADMLRKGRARKPVTARKG